MSDNPVVLPRITYADLTPWETVVFHEEVRFSIGDMQRMNQRVRAAEAAGTKDVDIGDIPIERMPLCLIAAAARRHTGNPDLSLQEAGSGGFVFAAEDEAEDPKGGRPAKKPSVE